MQCVKLRHRRNSDHAVVGADDGDAFEFPVDQRTAFDVQRAAVLVGGLIDVGLGRRGTGKREKCVAVHGKSFGCGK